MRDSESGDSEGEDAALRAHRDVLVRSALPGTSRPSDDADSDADAVARGGGDSPVGGSSAVEHNQNTADESNSEDHHVSQDAVDSPAKVLPALTDAIDPEPTPEPHAVVVSRGVVEFSLDSIRPHLTCRLCLGLFREPYTLAKCLHTFCKSCLHLAFANSHYRCPTCELYLGQNLSKCALADRALQNLIDKVLFPEVARQDRLDEEEFYGRLGIDRKRSDFGSPRPSREAPGPSKRRAEPSDLVTEEGGSRSAAKRARRNRAPSSRLNDGSLSSPSPLSPPSSMNGDVIFHLIPHDDRIGDGGDAAELDASELPALGNVGAGHALPPLANPYIKTSGGLRIGQLKKYLCRQLNLGPTAATASNPLELDASSASADSFLDHLEVLCLNVPLGNELSIRFAQRAVWIAPSSSTPGRGRGGGARESGVTEEEAKRDVVTFTYRLAKAPTPQG